MTSKLTRDRLQEIAEDGFLKHGESKELARMALAAMESEPVATLDVQSRRPDGNKFALVFSSAAHKLPDDVYFLYRYAQPAPVAPEEMTIRDACKFVQDMRLFDDVSVIVMRTWNACRATMLQASPVCTCPSGDGSLRWPCPVHAGSSPVIPDGSTAGMFNSARALLDALYEFGPDEIAISEHVTNLEDALRNAAAPQSPGSEPATVPGTWIPVSERLPEAGGDMIVFTDGIVMSGVSYAKKKGFYIQALEYDDDEPVDSVTHWMPLPAAPQEVKGD
nr:DUF551 domain-containing protein [Klebsiella variicola]